MESLCADVDQASRRYIGFHLGDSDDPGESGRTHRE